MKGRTIDGPPSIIITNYNYGRYVKAAIASALDQSVAVEVIVVDDGSTDDSLDVIAGFGDDITVIAQENGGQASAFNAGWRASSGPIVFFLDGDDLLESNAVAEVVGAFARAPRAGRCHFRLDWVDERGRGLPGSFPEPHRSLPSGDMLQRVSTNPADIAWQPTSGNAFRAETLDRLMPMPCEPYRISADHYLSNLSALHGPVLAIEKALGQYRVHGANADHRPGFDLQRARDILRRTEETHRRLIDHGSSLGIVGLPDDPSGFASLSQSGLRLASFRIGPAAAHPYRDDTRRSLLVAGWSAVRRRVDLRRGRRIVAAAWIVALAVAPRRYVGRIAGRGLSR